MRWYWKPTGGILRGKKVIKIQYTPRTDHLCHDIENNQMEYWGANICWPLTCELWARYHHHHLTINWKFWVTTSSERDNARSPLPHLRMHFSILRPFVKIPKRSPPPRRATSENMIPDDRFPKDGGIWIWMASLKFAQYVVHLNAQIVSKEPRKGINLLSPPHKPIHEVMACKNHLSVHAHTHITWARRGAVANSSFLSMRLM